jgi:hypothetical protein
MAWKNNGTPFVSVYGVHELPLSLQKAMEANNARNGNENANSNQNLILTSSSDMHRAIKSSLNDWNCLVNEVQHCSLENFKQLFPNRVAQPQRAGNHRVFRVKSSVLSSPAFKTTSIAFLCFALRSFEDLHDVQLGFDWIEIFGEEVVSSSLSQSSVEQNDTEQAKISMKRFRIPSETSCCELDGVAQKRAKEIDLKEAIYAQKHLKQLSRTIDAV